MHISSSQTKVTSTLLKKDTSTSTFFPNDTLALQTDKINLEADRPTKSGSKAMLFSAVLPGAGQVYAHRYYTIPIIWGCAVYFYSQWKYCNNIYKQFQRIYADSVTSKTASPELVQYYLSTRDAFHNHRDEFAIYIGLTYILNIIDAYVGATLYGFEVSDNLGGSAAIQFRIPLH